MSLTCSNSELPASNLQTNPHQRYEQRSIAIKASSNDVIVVNYTLVTCSVLAAAFLVGFLAFYLFIFILFRFLPFYDLVLYSDQFCVIHFFFGSDYQPA